MTNRTVSRLIPSIETSDGAGVKLRRSLGQRRGLYLDPFLMLDEFYSDNPDDYIAGFPSHPHRGFETVTYMLAGHLLHEDHLGNRGHLKDGGAQWMTTGSGVIHSEMPQQNAGLMRGFQLWINLPSGEKMQPARYEDIQSEQIPRVALNNGGLAILLAGTASVDGHSVTGYFNGLDGLTMSTDPVYIDLKLAAGSSVALQLPESHNVLAYAYDGTAMLAGTVLPHATAAITGPGDTLQLSAGDAPAGILILAARPINEPVVQYGPFVMNTQEEIEQALRDYRDGILTG
jgi:quercetin 2,3-dioxygenase